MAGTALTSLKGSNMCQTTLVFLLNKYGKRAMATRSSKAMGKIDRIVSSNKSVKSKPPRHLPAQGPNVSSTALHSVTDKEAMTEELSMDNAVLGRSLTRSHTQHKTVWKSKWRIHQEFSWVSYDKIAPHFIHDTFASIEHIKSPTPSLAHRETVKIPSKSTPRTLLQGKQGAWITVKIFHHRSTHG